MSWKKQLIKELRKGNNYVSILIGKWEQYFQFSKFTSNRIRSRINSKKMEETKKISKNKNNLQFYSSKFNA